MKKLILISFAAIALVALTTRYLLSIDAEFSALLSDDVEQHEFTHEFEKFTLTNTDANGQVESIIYSPRTYYDTTRQITTMEKPEIEMASDQDAPAKITADSAEVFHQDNITLLQDNVKVNVENEQNIRMSTDKLTLDHNQQIATTDLPATVLYKKGRMNSTGLEFKFDGTQIKFLDDVRGTYEY
ncbi:MAG: LPS export ABC transporter periplasmic protein LptC [Pseudomonadota bacterium]